MLIYLCGFFVFRKGGKDGAVQQCKNCNGRGIKVVLRQIGPGMVQQMQSACSECRGEGKYDMKLLYLFKLSIAETA